MLMLMMMRQLPGVKKASRQLKSYKWTSRQRTIAQPSSCGACFPLTERRWRSGRIRTTRRTTTRPIRTAASSAARTSPSDHLLSVHIEEQHDAFAAVLREKGEHTYSCFVEGCDRKCRTPQKRRMHLIDKHMYPKNFFFGVTKDGIDGRSSLLIESAGHRRRGSSISQNGGQKAAARRHSLRSQTAEAAVADTTTHAAAAPEVEAKGSMASSKDKDTPRPKSADTTMADLESAMSALQFVPPSIRFGRGKGKSGFAKK
ncbi:hypothetical protein PG987_004629 [Apiospora arundinis]